jgi:hypothetical protein
MEKIQNVPYKQIRKDNVLSSRNHENTIRWIDLGRIMTTINSSNLNYSPIEALKVSSELEKWNKENEYGFTLRAGDYKEVKFLRN